MKTQRLNRCFSIALGLSMCATVLRGQTLDSLDLPPGGLSVGSLLEQPTGKLLVSGFMFFPGSSYAARLHSNGSFDPSFLPDPNYGVDAWAQLQNGNILMGGQFTMVSGLAHGPLARFNTDGTLDTSFNPVNSGAVSALAVQSNGTIMVSGFLPEMDAAPTIRRLLPNGSFDPGFAATCDNQVKCLAVQPDGRILAGGGFFNLNGVAQEFIGRIFPDGSLDLTFTPEIDGEVHALILQPDGRILVGGTFTTVSGEARPCLARLNPNGSLDTSFNPQLASESGSLLQIYTMALQTDGAILVGGTFDSVNGQARRAVARLQPNGALDNTFNAAIDTPGSGSIVSALCLEKNGSLVFGGSFTQVLAQARSSLARVTNPTAAPQSLTEDATGITWLRGGSCVEVDWVTFDFSNDGITWVPLGNGTRINGGWKLAGTPPPAGHLRARGYFQGGQNNASSFITETIDGPVTLVSDPLSVTNLAGMTATFEVSAGGSEPLSFQWYKGKAKMSNGGNVAGATTGTLTLSNIFGNDAGLYSVVISNTFGAITSKVARLVVVDPWVSEPPVRLWGNLGQTLTNTVSAVGSPALSYQWLKDGNILPGATFPTLVNTNLQPGDDGEYATRVSNAYGSITSAPARLTFCYPAPDSFAPDVRRSVFPMAIQRDGSLLVGGVPFFEADVPRLIDRYDQAGRIDTSFNPAVDGFTATSMITLPDGKVIIGGNFQGVGGQPRSNLVRLNGDGTLDLSFNPAPDGIVAALALQPDGRIVVGGNFQHLGTRSKAWLARLNSDGTVDTSFVGSANSPVNTLAMQPDGKILAGGYFSTLSGGNRNIIGRLLPSGSLDTAFNPAASGTVDTIVVQPDGKVLVGGFSLDFPGLANTGLARLNANGSLDTSFNPQLEGNPGEVHSIALQTDGRIIVGGRFTGAQGSQRFSLARFHPTGALDTTFKPEAHDGSASGQVYSLALQPDGKLVVGGAFAALGGQERLSIGKLENPTPVTSQLTLNNSTITWTRTGPGPEVWYVRFQYTVDGTNWYSLGTGSRISNGWQLANVSVPANANIRALGFITSGMGNNSTWMVEKLLSESIQLESAWQTNSMALRIRGLAGIRAVVEASTNLSNWFPVTTNTLTGTTTTVLQESTPGKPQKFYRARVD